MFGLIRKISQGFLAVPAPAGFLRNTDRPALGLCFFASNEKAQPRPAIGAGSRTTAAIGAVHQALAAVKLAEAALKSDRPALEIEGRRRDV